jgi:hypothetical protein
MPSTTCSFHLFRCTRRIVSVAAVLCLARGALAQNTPLLSGGVGAFTQTRGGNTNYTPQIQPLIDVPLGDRVLVESRAVVSENFAQSGAGQGFDHSHFVALAYLQGDFFVTSHLTVVAGSYLTPFNVFNERLSPIWINNFEDGPLSSSIGAFGTGTGLGAQLRGSAISRQKFSLDYVAFLSTRSGNFQFNAERAAGGRVAVYLPEKRVEAGFSYGRLLQGKRENFFGTHVWWEPANTAFRLRTEYAHGEHASGYWVEADYRTQAFGGLESWVGRIEPVFRMQQTFNRDRTGVDGTSGVDTQRADFGLDYNLPHNTRILTSYSRQFSSHGNANLWQTGVVYRFLLPAWKGK